jgi:hypothetical protein
MAGQDCPEWTLPEEAPANSTRDSSCWFDFLVKKSEHALSMWDEMN